MIIDNNHKNTVTSIHPNLPYFPHFPMTKTASVRKLIKCNTRILEQPTVGKNPKLAANLKVFIPINY